MAVALWTTAAVSAAEGPAPKAQLLVGAATADITPPLPVALTGFPTVRLARKIQSPLTASVQALMLIAISAPKWNPDLELAAGSDGAGAYADEAVMGDFVISVAPGANLRYDF